MDKQILVQYIDLKAEIEDLEQLISKTRKAIVIKEEKNGQVSDYVKGTRRDGTYGGIHIAGYPYQECEGLKDFMIQRGKKLATFRDKLMELTNEVDDFINELNDTRMRRMLRYKYFDGLSWVQVAHRIGGNCSADSCRNCVDRFLGKR